MFANQICYDKMSVTAPASSQLVYSQGRLQYAKGKGLKIVTTVSCWHLSLHKRLQYTAASREEVKTLGAFLKYDVRQPDENSKKEGRLKAQRSGRQFAVTIMHRMNQGGSDGDATPENNNSPRNF